MNQNSNNIKTRFYDFLSYPHNPEELFTLLYIIEKKENYEIYKAIYNETREIFSIKIIPLDEKASFHKLNQESLIMKSLKKNENIIHYYGSFFSFKLKNIWLVFEYCPPGSVYDLLKAIERPLIEQEISIIINDILHGLIYMHQLNITHTNIKLSNILISENGVAKLGNFSYAIQKLNNSINSKEKSIIEVNNPKYDIFSIGIACLELFKGINDFDRNKIIELIKNNNNNNRSSIKSIIEKNFFSGNELLCSKDFIDFVQKCLTSNLYKRPTAFELKNHIFIKKNINTTNSEKLYFLNLIKYNIEKIEYSKKEKNYSVKEDKKNNEKENEKEKEKEKEKENEKEKEDAMNFSHLYSSFNSNTKKDNNSHINSNDKNSMNINSNIIKSNKNDENNTHLVDKIAEFRIEQMRKNEIVEFDKYTNKDIIVDNSNLDNTGFHYGTDDSYEKSLKESAVFGKGDILKHSLNNKTFINDKKPLLYKDILNGEEKKFTKIKKEEKKNNKENKEKSNKYKMSEKEINFFKKESNDIDYFKANWEHLNKYENIINNNNSESNLNYDYNTHLLRLNSDESIDTNNINFNNNININNDPNSIYLNSNTNNEFSKSINNTHDNKNSKVFTKYVPFSEMKCNIIQLGTSVKKYKTTQKSCRPSDYSLKNTAFKVNDTNSNYSLRKSENKNKELDNIDNKKNNNKNINKKKLLLSFGNNNTNDMEFNNIKKSYTKEKIYKNDSSTCFASLNTPINKIKGFMEIITEKQQFSSYKPFFTVREKKYEESDKNSNDNINSKKVGKKEKINLIKISSEYKNLKSNQKPYLYEYIKDFDNVIEEKIQKKKQNVIRVEKQFNKKNTNKRNTKKNNNKKKILKKNNNKKNLERNIKNVKISDEFLK